MKKTGILLLVIVLLGITQVKSQEQMFFENDKVINLGIGIGSTLWSGRYYTTNIPPLSGSFELGIRDNLLDVEGLTLGVGGYVGFATATWESTWGNNTYGWRYTNIILAGRGAVHYPIIDNLDTYTGLMIGPNIVVSSSFGTFSDATSSARGSGLVYSYFFGARYYFGSNIAVLGELGYGISYLNIGVALKL